MASTSTEDHGLRRLPLSSGGPRSLAPTPSARGYEGPDYSEFDLCAESLVAELADRFIDAEYRAKELSLT